MAEGRSSALSSLLTSAKGLLLDFDGVLADSEELHFRCYDAAFRAFGHSLDPEEYRRFWVDEGAGFPGEVARHHLLGIDRAQVEEDKKRRFSAACRRGEARLHLDALSLLSHISRSPLPTAIASNTAAVDIQEILATGGFSTPPLPLQGGEPGLRSKPHPDLFLAAAKRLGVPASSCLVVEDTTKGLRAATAAGMKGIMIRRPHNLDRAWPDAAMEIGNLLELLECFP